VLASFDVGIASRLMRALENDDPKAAALLHGLPALEQAPHVIGVTGAGGVGKSSLISKLVCVWRERGLRVGVLAIDPSSSLSGGALLGDRVRMVEHAGDAAVFVRSVGSRGGTGGVAATTAQMIDVMQHMRCDVVVVETLGAGQDELAVASLVDTTVLLAMPMAGDHVQAMKAGLIELADVIAVNKSDLAGAGLAAAELQVVAQWSTRVGRGPAVVLQTSAATGAGVVELAAVIDALRPDDQPPKRRFTGLAAIEGQLLGHVRNSVAAWLRDSPAGQRLCERVSSGQHPVAEAATVAWRAVSGD
jgi:LAO/AO transport system kinase